MSVLYTLITGVELIMVMNRKITALFIIAFLTGMGIVIFSERPSIPLYKKDTDISPVSSAAEIKVMTSINIVQEIVQSIVGNLSEVDVIVSGTADIHTAPGPTEAQKLELSQSDLFFVFGLPDLEPWLEDTLNSLGSDAPKTVYLISESMMRYDPLIGSKNPHVWLDPDIVKTIADNVTRELSNVYPEYASIFAANNATFAESMDELLDEIQGNATLLRGTKVVVNHPAFMYLLDLLGINRTYAIEKVEGQEPTPSEIANLIRFMNDNGIKLIVNVQWVSQSEVNEIARSTGAKIALLVPLIAGTDQNGDPITSYAQMIRYDLWALNHPSEPPSDTIPGYPMYFIILVAAIAVGTIIRKIDR